MDERENLQYPIPYQGEEIWPEKQWQWEEERTLKALEDDELVITKTDNGWSVNYKQYLRDEDGVERGAKPFSVLEGPYTQTGTDEIKAIFGNGKVFPFPKPTKLIRHFLSFIHNDKEAIILDFFAGSCPTAHALIEFNIENPGNRKFICVQIPEPVVEESDAGRAGFKTIAEIGRERIRRVIERINAEAGLASPDPANLGFKSFILAPSNFRQWRGDAIDTPDQLAEQMAMFVKSEKDGADSEDIIYELLLKFGQEPTVLVERIYVNDLPIFAIHGGKMLFVIDGFNEEMIEMILSLKPREIIALDSVFHDSDELKTNLDLQCRDAGVKFTCI